jgi:hypothetical protein
MRSFELMNAFELWGHILTYETEEPEKVPRCSCPTAGPLR